MTSVSNKQSTTVIDSDDFSIDNIKFAPPLKCTVPNSTLSYYRVNVLNKNGGDCVILTPKFFSFGVNEDINPTNKKLNGYKLCLCLHSNNGATESEKRFVYNLDKLKAKCTEYLTDPDVYSQFGFDDEDIVKVLAKKMQPYYVKKDKATNKPDPSKGPMLYLKLLTRKARGNKNDGNKNDKNDIETKKVENKDDDTTNIEILTKFYDSETDDVIEDPKKTLMNQNCFVVVAMKVESIYISTDRFVIQLKAYEVIHQPQNRVRQRLLPHTKSSEKSIEQKTETNKTETHKNETNKTEQKHMEETEEPEDEIPNVPLIKKNKDKDNSVYNQDSSTETQPVKVTRNKLPKK